MIFAATVGKFQGFCVFSPAPEKEGQEAPKGGLREAKMTPRSAPRRARSGPRGAKTAPGARQERPKSRPRGAKKEQKRSLLSRSVSVASRGPFWSDFRTLRGVIFEPPGGHFGAISAAFSRLRSSCFSAALGSPCSGRTQSPGGKPQENTRNAPSSNRPAQAAQRPSKGIKRSTLLAILISCARSFVSPLLLRL